MEDIVGIRVQKRDGTSHGVLSWGRIGDRVKDDWLIDGYMASLSHDARGEIEKIEVCESLRDLASCKYFFEGLFDFAIRGIPYGQGYAAWHSQQQAAYSSGAGDFYDVGPIENAPV